MFIRLYALTFLYFAVALNMGDQNFYQNIRKYFLNLFWNLEKIRKESQETKQRPVFVLNPQVLETRCYVVYFLKENAYKVQNNARLARFFTQKVYFTQGVNCWSY